jgi:hypothetical protein
MRGEYLIYNKGGLVKEIIPNTVVEQGQIRIYEAVFQNATALKPMGTMEIALIDEVPSYAGLVAAITTEPTLTNGYARQSLTATTANWTVDTINGVGRVTSAVKTFTAAGGDFSRAYSRYMLSEVGGEIISYSSPISAPRIVLNTESVNVAYRMYNK